MWPARMFKNQKIIRSTASTVFAHILMVVLTTVFWLRNALLRFMALNYRRFK